MKKTLERLIAGGRLSNQHIFLFGHCDASERAISYLLKKKIEVRGILDNNPYKTGKTCRGIEIAKPETVLSSPASKTVVLIASRAYSDMAGQLEEIGFQGRIERIVNCDSFSEYSLSGQVLREKEARVGRGARVLQEIRELSGKNLLVLCPYPALGDVYYAMAYLPAYLKKLQRGPCAVCVVGDACGETAGLFGEKQIIRLDRTRMDELVQAALYYQEKNCVIAHHDRPYTDNLIEYLNEYYLPFEELYKYGVYGLDKASRPVWPERYQEFQERGKIKRGRTVILAPSAKSVLGVPSGFWRRAADQCRRRGLEVFTNVAGEELPIPGTQPLSIPIPQMVPAAEYAGYFIGMRSGLCDIVSRAECVKTVVFPDAYYSSTRFKVEQFFELPGWRKIVVKSK